MKTTKNLQIRKETLRRLEERALKQAVGGIHDSAETCFTCWTCPTDRTCDCPEL